MHFWIFWDFFGFFGFLKFFRLFFDFWISWNFWNFFVFLLIFFSFLEYLSKLLRLLLKVTKVTTGHQKLPKIGQNSIITSFFPEGQKKSLGLGQNPPQELVVLKSKNRVSLLDPLSTGFAYKWVRLYQTPLVH